MKRPQTEFHIHTMMDSHLIRSKKSKFIIRLKSSCSTIFSLYRYFIETATTDSTMLMHV